MNVAVIGIGAMGKNHARVYSELSNVNLVSVCDADSVSGKEIADKFNAKYYEDCESMLNNEKIDAVSICVPTKLHKKIALSCIKRNVNILIEKPIASSVEEAEQIIEEAEKNNVKVMVGHIERFNPIVMELKKRIKNNELGKIFMVKSERFSPFPKRVVDVGVTIDLSVHDVDIMHHLLESKIKSVYCVNSQKIHSSHEDLMTSILNFTNGAIGTTSCNWVTPKIVRELTIIGEKGMFKADYLTQELILFKNEFTDKYIDWEKKKLNVVQGESMEIKVEKKEPLKNELESFVSYVSSGNSSPISGEAGKESLKVALKLLESSKTNEVIDL